MPMPHIIYRVEVNGMGLYQWVRSSEIEKELKEKYPDLRFPVLFERFNSRVISPHEDFDLLDSLGLSIFEVIEFMQVCPTMKFGFASPNFLSMFYFMDREYDILRELGMKFLQMVVPQEAVHYGSKDDLKLQQVMFDSDHICHVKEYNPWSHLVEKEG
jgi:hypothetical protein